jgi:hypothetical protein
MRRWYSDGVSDLAQDALCDEATRLGDEYERFFGCGYPDPDEDEEDAPDDEPIRWKPNTYEQEVCWYECAC